MELLDSNRTLDHAQFSVLGREHILISFLLPTRKTPSFDSMDHIFQRDIFLSNFLGPIIKGQNV
jgi:hypothetical protein